MISRVIKVNYFTLIYLLEAKFGESPWHESLVNIELHLGGCQAFYKVADLQSFPDIHTKIPVMESFLLKLQAANFSGKLLYTKTFEWLLSWTKDRPWTIHVFRVNTKYSVCWKLLVDFNKVNNQKI